MKSKDGTTHSSECRDEIIREQGDPEEMVSSGKAMKCLIVRDHESKAVFGHPVAQKGDDDAGYAVSRVVEDVKWLGYNRLILKSDNEPSILSLVSTALKMIRIDGMVDQVGEEHPHKYESQSNGATEVAVRELRGAV